MKKNLLYCCLFVFVLASCKQEETPDLYDQTEEYCKAENMVFKCDRTDDEVYFEGKINGEEFCVSYPGNGGFLSNSIWTATTTPASNPTFSNNTPIQSSFFGFMIAPKFREDSQIFHEDFDPFIMLWTPHIADSVTYSASKYLDDFVREAEDLPLMSAEIDKFSGFEFRIAWSCVFLPGYEYYDEKNLTPGVVGGWLTPTLGKQPDVIFRVSRLEKVETIMEIHYDITFEIECDLYTQNVRGTDTRYFGRLEDGVFRTKFSVAK